MLQVPTQIDVLITVLGGVLSAIAAFRVPRRELDRVPLSGLTLLWIVYVLAGWGLAASRVAFGIWVCAALAALAVAVGSSLQLGRSGLVVLSLAGVSAIAGVLLRDQNAELARWSAAGLVATGIWLWAVGGAKYRMERAGFRRSSVMRTLTIIGWEGLWVGWLVNKFIVPQVGTWLT
ncbi:hypothetical protein NC981_08265 [Leptolyngbya sp. DQ-M1]|uniref:hypothetical protein n=1 Tax=Leptolyngbya sp. DQ-M1 TaxID=2933920 RepID=UPI00329A2FDD